MARKTHSRSRRGTALIFAVVMLAVLAIVGLAIIGQANAEGDGSVAKRQYDRSIACADAARELLNSQFRLYGLNPTTLTLDTPLEYGASTSVPDRSGRTGHYDSVTVTNAVVAATGSTSGSMGVSDMSNRTVRTALGGQLYRMTVVCSSAGNSRQSEIEFLVKFGL